MQCISRTMKGMRILSSYIPAPFLLCLVVGAASAQHVSPLQHLITSNTQIRRPEIFRTMQHGVEKEWGKLDEGTRLELLDKQAGKLRANILSVFDSAKAEIVLDANTTFIKVSLANQEYRIPITGVSFTRAFEQGMLDAGDKFRTVFDVAIDNATFGSRNISAQLFQQVLFSGLLSTLNRAQTQSGATGSIPERVAEILNGGFQKTLREWIQQQDPLFNFSDPNAWASLIQRQGANFNTLINMEVKKATAEARQLVSDALDIVEQRIRTAVDQFDKWLVAANAGFGVTEGKGDLAGGIHLSYTQSENLQIGAYVNGNLDPADSTKPAGAVGAQLRFSGDWWQLDGLISGIRGTTWGLEAGLGGSARIGEHTLVGLGYFVISGTMQIDGKSVNGWSLATTLTGTEAGSPLIILGLSVRNGKTHPLFQVSYPLTAQQ